MLIEKFIKKIKIYIKNHLCPCKQDSLFYINFNNFASLRGNIKDIDISEKQNLTFYLEIIEGKMIETTRDKVNNFVKILETQFPDLFTQFE